MTDRDTSLPSGNATRHFALLGNPVGHSLSAKIHAAAFQLLGMRATYEALTVASRDLADVAQSLRSGELDGANVTIPHKQAVVGLLDELSNEAKACGAVNTIVRSSKGYLRGENTDVPGFMAPLKKRDIPIGNRAVVLGAGGAAGAVVYALLNTFQLAEIIVASRRVAQAEDLVRHFGGENGVSLRALEWSERHSGMAEVDLIVNTTPVGMWPNAQASPIDEVDVIQANQTVYDLVYNPEETKLIVDAQKQGASTIGGMEMLLAQAAESFAMWTGQRMPIAQVRAMLSL